MGSAGDRGSHGCDPCRAGLNALPYDSGSNLSLIKAGETAVAARCAVFELAKRGEILYNIAV